MSGDWKPIWEKMRDWHEQGLRVGLATVVKTWGSSPRPVGSHLVLNETGLMEGSVSGGCVEGAVIAALEVAMSTGETKILDFTVSDNQAWEVGLSCGGSIKVLVEPADQKFELIEEILASKTDLLLTTYVVNGATKIKTATDAKSSQLTETDGGLVFEQVLVQPLELLIIGAVHIAQAMVQMAQTLGVNVTVIDPRPAFANEERFSGIELVRDWPDDALRNRDITSGTAIVTLTHDPKLDDAALELALKSPAFYISSLGSRKTHAARLERLGARGFSENELVRIHGPAGLNIGAKTPAEIALSVLAELTSVYRLGRAP